MHCCLCTKEANLNVSNLKTDWFWSLANIKAVLSFNVQQCDKHGWISAGCTGVAGMLARPNVWMCFRSPKQVFWMMMGQHLTAYCKPELTNRRQQQQEVQRGTRTKKIVGSLRKGVEALSLHHDMWGFPTGTGTVVKTWFWKTNVWMRSKTQRKMRRMLTYWIQANLMVSQKPGR